MKICIDMGHTPASTGASGYFSELTEDREVGKRVIEELKKRGHSVSNSTPADNVAYPNEVNQRVNYEHNNGPFDLFVSIHFNAFNGSAHGTEVLYFAGDSTGCSYAERISQNVADSMGITNRGAKANDWVGVICNTWSHAVLIEVCFCDNYEDFKAYCNTSYKDIVDAICDGIEKKKWVKKIEKPAPEPEPEPEQSEEKLPPKNGQEKAPECNCEELALKAVADLEKRVEAIENKNVAQLVIEELIKRLSK